MFINIFSNNKYKDELYLGREIINLKTMIDESARLYKNEKAYLIKKTPADKYTAISFSQMKSDIDALGSALLSMGLKDKKIAVIGENRYEWVISYLAVVCGIGVIVPIDRELPQEEIENLLERADVACIIYSEKFGTTVENAMMNIDGIECLISMDRQKNDGKIFSFNSLIKEGKLLISSGVLDYINLDIDSEKMAIILFTSGTTGLAKGVMLSHKNICSNIYNLSKQVKITSNDISLSVLPIHHTYEFTCNILTCIYQGGCIAFCEGLKHIVKNMSESKATIMLAVPLIFESMHKKIWKRAEISGKASKLRKAVNISKTLNLLNIKTAKRMFKDVHLALGGNVRMFISGAAGIDPLVVEDFNAMGITMFQGYGLTESSPIVAVNKDRCYKAASVGLIMPESELQIIEKDSFGIGEILTKSDSVMLGYYENEEETSKIIKDGWLYTGDYGYLDDDGFLYITGRKKNVIVTKNGKNIFPEEVELYLMRSPYISEVVVYGKEEEDGGENLVCAEIYPNSEYILEKCGVIDDEKLQAIMKTEIDIINDYMPIYKRVKRFQIRNSEFEKTTTKKIKRYKI